MMWAIAAGLVFSLLNASMRGLTQELPPLQVQFLRYLFGLLVMIPLILRAGLVAYRPNGLGGQVWRGVVHTVGLMLWFSALPHMPLADMTAIGFTTPIFIMIGAGWLLGEKITRVRWIAALLGFGGVMFVVAPQFVGHVGVYSVVMLLSCPMFAASFLITKALTKRDSAEVIVVWQSITVALFTLPIAIVVWVAPTPMQWVWFVITGVLGSAGHYCLTTAFHHADISATQSVRFLDLIWASLLGMIVFGDIPTQTTIIGGLLIFGSTLWVARREARAAGRAVHLEEDGAPDSQGVVVADAPAAPEPEPAVRDRR